MKLVIKVLFAFERLYIGIIFLIFLIFLCSSLAFALLFIPMCAQHIRRSNGKVSLDKVVTSIKIDMSFVRLWSHVFFNCMSFLKKILAIFKLFLLPNSTSLSSFLSLAHRPYFPTFSKDDPPLTTFAFQYSMISV